MTLFAGTNKIKKAESQSLFLITSNLLSQVSSYSFESFGRSKKVPSGNTIYCDPSHAKDHNYWEEISLKGAGSRNVKQLATENYKTIHHENPSFMEEIFRINESPYNLRGVTFTRNKPNTVPYGLDTISYRCQEVWNSIPTEITSSPNINIFKASIKNLSAMSCSCRICKPFIRQIGYIE